MRGQEVDVALVLPDGEDFATRRRVDPTRRAMVDQALTRSDAATLAQRNKGKTRTLFVAVPTPSDIASTQMDNGQYEAISWRTRRHGVDRVRREPGTRWDHPPIAGGWTVPLLKATVEADGKVIVKDGKLAL